MNHLSEEQLILYRYGDAADTASIEEHLAACMECRASYEALQRTLAAVDATPVPHRDEAYGREVWARIEPRLHKEPWWLAWFAPQRLVLAGAMVVLLVVAFYLGRISPRQPDVAAVATPPEVRERILLVAVGDHLERSQMVLVELVNTRPADGVVDISTEQRRAEDLVSANRLYRQTATASGDKAVADLLDELERFLVEIANSPSQMSSQELAALQRRIEARGILFKVRVVGSQMREKTSSPPPKQGRV